MNRRAFYSAEQRQELLREFEQSGLSATEFARQKGIERTLLPVWRQRYGPRGTPPATTAKVVPWQEVKLQDVLGQGAWAAEVLLPGGIRLRLDAAGRGQVLEHLLGRLI